MKFKVGDRVIIDNVKEAVEDIFQHWVSLAGYISYISNDSRLPYDVKLDGRYLLRPFAESELRKESDNAKAI